MLKSAWAYRNGKRIMKEAMAVSKEYEANKAAKIKPVSKKRKEEIKKAELSQFEILWDALRPGVNLSKFGIHGIIKKKNHKSIVLESGSKWTKRELYLQI